MNQILVINKNYKKLKIYRFVFFISITICLYIFIYLFSSFYVRFSKINETNLLKNKYIINTLYSSNTNHTILKLSNNIYIIGLIEIPKINISYPIIENTNEELLKASVCRFSGPLPNRIGNLCIAGHNYNNTLMFSNLYKLNIGDTIYITDLNNTKLEYIIYDKYHVDENNLKCIENSKNIELTLITCKNSNNKKRTIIKAKMKG